ncbi:MAG: aspartyl protease family protein [Planctomycetia bacterium]|nr:aspartyl protease family protein [Planctomycetia bacterium]
MKTSSKLVLLAGLLALCPANFATTQDKEPPKKEAPKKAEKPIVVPFELLKSRHMAIDVKINGKGPYRLIFDTGAPMNLVTNKVAKESGLLDKKDKGGLPLFGAAMGAKTIKKFELGDLTLEGMPTMVMDHPTVAALAEVIGPLEGIIGYPFFARYKMTIDYQKKEMTLVPNGYEPGDAMKGLMNKLLSSTKGEKPEPTVIAPAAIWGFTVDKEKDDEAEGVKVTEVLAKSPAATGGLKVGDRVITLDGRWTDTVSDTFVAASSVKPGKPAVLVIKRDGKEMKLTITPGKGL